MRFMQLLRILRAHIGLIAATVLCAWLAAVAATLFMPPSFVATSSVLVDFADNPAAAGAPSPQLYSGYLATQIDLLASQSVALKAVDQLRLAEDATARARYLGSATTWQDRLERAKRRIRNVYAKVFGASAPTPESADDARYQLADQLLKRTTVRPSPDSSVMQISYAAATAQAAATAANTIVKAYIDTTLELNVNPARASSEWLDKQIERLSSDVKQARAALADFQQRTGIVGGDQANDVETARLNDLNSQLVAAQAQNHPAIQALKSDLQRAQAKLNDLPPQLGPNHPTYKNAQAEVRSLRAQLQQESAELAAGLRAEIGQQRGAILHMKQQHGQLTALKDAADSAQRALDDAVQKAGLARMNSQITQTNVAVIRTAVPPRQATTPNPLFNFSLATAIGLLLGVGLGLWREVVCRFVRSADDIRDFLGLQVLGVLHSGRRSASGRARLPAGAPLLTGQ
jgi:uncharacterized protein involved in exopolysaccharide biosynthesis